MRFEWDERKRRSNLEKHGLDFADAEHAFTDAAIVDPDVRHSEPRHLLVGPLFGRLVVVVFTVRGEAVRVISMRNANRREQKRYAQERPQAG